MIRLMAGRPHMHSEKEWKGKRINFPRFVCLVYYCMRLAAVSTFAGFLSRFVLSEYEANNVHNIRTWKCNGGNDQRVKSARGRVKHFINFSLWRIYEKKSSQNSKTFDSLGRKLHYLRGNVLEGKSKTRPFLKSSEAKNPKRASENLCHDLN